MKKKKLLSLILISVLLSCVFAFGGCSMFYDIDETERFAIGYSKFEKNAFIASCFYRSGESMTFVIPDEYKGIPITEFGGYFGTGVPCPFHIDMEIGIEDGENTESWVSKESFEDDEYEIAVFTVKIGKNLQKLSYVDGKIYYGISTDNGGERVSDTLYKVVYRFEVSADNPAFYSLDGKLYDKSASALITDFFYE